MAKGRNKKEKRFEIPDPSEVINDKDLKFSFKYYDTQCNDFCISTWGKDKISATLKALQDINNKTYSDLLQGSAVYHFHQVYWEQTTKKQGFPSVQANQFDAFQFALIGVNGQKARVYGALAKSTFYVVWFDLEHNIWPSFKKHT